MARKATAGRGVLGLLRRFLLCVSHGTRACDRSNPRDTAAPTYHSWRSLLDRLPNMDTCIHMALCPQLKADMEEVVPRLGNNVLGCARRQTCRSIDGELPRLLLQGKENGISTRKVNSMGRFMRFTGLPATIVEPSIIV